MDSLTFMPLNDSCMYVVCTQTNDFIFEKTLDSKTEEYSKTCVKQPLSERPKIGFYDQLSLNAGQRYCRMLQGEILQYFRPSTSYHLSLRPLFCLFLGGRFSQVLL